MKRIIVGAIVLCLMLSGCSSWMDGYYASVKPHMGQKPQVDGEIIAVSNSQEIRDALASMVENAVESRTISAENMPSEALERNIQRAIQYTLDNHPIAAYAVENIEYETGITGGVFAAVITVQYNHNRTEIQQIRQVDGMEWANGLIYAALDELEPGIVLQVSNYVTTDFAQLVEDYSLQRPDEVMEIPQVIANVYPDRGLVRVVELKFTYQNSRDTLRQMQRYVQPRFTAASLYVSGDEAQEVKFSRLYAFLMETASYTVETSITPAYSLLRHNVGDSRAFATVYAAMCRQSGLDCRVVTGTNAGEPWFWNMICEDGAYYHVDLLRSYGNGLYQKLTDNDMEGYVWDYTAYPKCESSEEVEEET